MCLLKTGRVDDFAKIDEKKARQEQIERNEAYDKIKNTKNDKLKKEEAIAQKINYDSVMKKHSEFSPRKVLERERKMFTEKNMTNPAWATIKLPEIMAGYEEKDFK
jgi:hypothetical protein